MKRKSLAFDCVIFDIDNVLVNTQRSYLDAIRWTVDIYLTSGTVPFFQPSRPSGKPQILSLEDVSQFKLLGGFNDDWDCCYGLLVYLLSLPVKTRTAAELKKRIDIPAFAKSVYRKPLGVAGITRKLGRRGEVRIEKISRIFQEVYLGKDLFEQWERKKAVYWQKRGLLLKEKLIFRKSFLRRMHRLGLGLGIATGRPQVEASYALERFGIADFFQALTTIDDVKKAEREEKRPLRKPHPFSILETAKKLGGQKRFLYVGDLPDDVLAAQEAKGALDIRSALFPNFSMGRLALAHLPRKMKPDFFLKRPKDLFGILAASTSQKNASRDSLPAPKKRRSGSKRR